MKLDNVCVFLLLFFGSCANQVQVENRLEQEFIFQSVISLESEASEIDSKEVSGNINLLKNY